jgi:hypothetical protein
MSRFLDPFRFVLITVAGWMNQRQLQAIDYLREESRVLREQLGDRRQLRRRIAGTGKGHHDLGNQSGQHRGAVHVALDIAFLLNIVYEACRCREPAVQRIGRFFLGYPVKAPLIDVHSHYWEYPAHFSDDFKAQAKRARGDVEVDLTVRWNEYADQARTCDKTVVFGGKAKLLGLWVPDRAVAAYAARHPDRLIAFLSLDPTQPGWQDELQEGIGISA